LVTEKRAFIVRNGSLYIKSNITTLNTSGNQTAGQLFLGVMNDTGLANLTTLDATNVTITSSDKSGWLFVDTGITNLDAFLFAQGPMVSYKDDDLLGGNHILYSKTLSTEKNLYNQVSIFGSILTLNTITGSRKTTPECPYIIDSCTADISQIFDLAYTRSFKLMPLSIMTGNVADNATIVPYYP
jgi:hypothetical protein